MIFIKLSRICFLFIVELYEKKLNKHVIFHKI